MPLSLALLLVSAGACKSETEVAPSAEDGGEGGAAEGEQAAGAAAGTQTAQAPEQGTSGGSASAAADERGGQVTIARAEAAMSVGASGAKNMGFNLEKIWHLFALEATAKLPEWGAKGEGEASSVRDGDLDTAWTCEFGQASPCVLGMGLPEPGKVEAIRLYTATGPRFRDYTGHPRAAKVRVHTDLGHVDVALADGANHSYVRFAEPVTTQSLALEVLEVHAGKKNQLLQIAELEIYGTDGVPRPALELDPRATWTSWETTVWGGPELDHTIRQIFIYQGESGDGGELVSRKRIARATAVFGHAGDDYALFERLNGTDCETIEGGYVLFDKRSRVYYPIGDLGGAGAEVYRHSAGHGFAVGWTNAEGQFTIKGIVEEEGKLKRKRPPRDGVPDAKAQLREWGFETEPLSRGEGLRGAVAGCHRAGAGELAALEGTLDAEAPRDPAQWMVCGIGTDTLYASASCGGKALAYQLDDAGKVVGEHESKDSDARGLRLRRLGDQLYVELSSKDGDSASLYLATPGAFTQLERSGGIATRPPSSCTACSDEWPNPEAVAAVEPEPEPEPILEPEPEPTPELTPPPEQPAPAPAQPTPPPAPPPPS